MKRKYAAMVLGLALTLTSMNAVYATDSTAAAIEETTAEDAKAADDTLETTEGEADSSETDAEEENASEMYGKVTEIGEDGLTISVGKPKNPEGMAEVEDPAVTDVQEDENTELPEDSSEASEDADNADEAFSVLYEEPFELELTGEEQTVSFAENALFEREVKPEENDEIDESAAEDVKNAETESADTDAADTVDAADASDADTDDTGEELETESITLTDIKVGDIVKITLDADGNAEKVIVLAVEMSEDEEVSEEVSAEEAEDVSADAESETEENAEPADSTEAE